MTSESPNPEARALVEKLWTNEPDENGFVQVHVSALDEAAKFILSQQAARGAAEKEREEARDLVSRLRLEAQGHASEARAANSTIYEIYQVLSGGKGEPGNWHGAEPARAFVEAAERKIADLEAAVRGLLRAEYESAGHGLLDCVDNDGEHYQSQFLADQIKRAETLLRSTRMTQVAQDIFRLMDARVAAYIEDYEFRGDVDHTPSEDETVMLIDALHGFVADTEEALRAPTHVSEEGEDRARHFIDRYASGIDAEPQMDRIRAALAVDRPAVAPVSEGEAFPCEDCGGSTRAWFAPNALWNRVKGGPDAKDDPGGFLCPNCFIDRAAAAGIKPTAWMLDEEHLDRPAVAVPVGVTRAATDLLGALQKYGFPVSDAATRALVDGGSIEAQAVHVAAIGLRSALLAAAPAPQGDGAVEVNWPRGTRVEIEHDGFVGPVIGEYERLDGYRGAVVQFEGKNIVHCYGEKFLPPPALQQQGTRKPEPAAIRSQRRSG